MISGNTKVCAVIGDPISHSLSPCIHNAAFQHLQLDYVYVAFRVGHKQLDAAIQGIRSLRIYGINVTTPHKVAVIQHLDQLDESVMAVGAVNTILNDHEILVGYNTDGKGALMALEASKQGPANKKVVILGAGGASRAISYSLAKKAHEVVILNRTLEKAEKLAMQLSKTFGNKVRCGPLCRDCMKKELKDANILVNATTLGMRPNHDKTPVDKDLLRPDLVVFDLVYDPHETRLLKEARSVGARPIGGLTMLVSQAAVSFEIWTKEKAPIDVMTKAALEKLRGK